MKALLSHIIFLTVICSVVTSCKSKQNATKERHSLPACGGNFGSYPVEKVYRPVSIFELGMVVNYPDTLLIDQLFLTDSLRFIQAFTALEVSEMCIEMQVEGNTYYSVIIDDTGHFKYMKALKTVDSCFNSFDKRVEQTLSQTKVLSSEYYNTELVFGHKFRLH